MKMDKKKRKLFHPFDACCIKRPMVKVVRQLSTWSVVPVFKEHHLEEDRFIVDSGGSGSKQTEHTPEPVRPPIFYTLINKSHRNRVIQFLRSHYRTIEPISDAMEVLPDQINMMLRQIADAAIDFPLSFMAFDEDLNITGVCLNMPYPHWKRTLLRLSKTEPFSKMAYVELLFDALSLTTIPDGHHLQHALLLVPSAARLAETDSISLASVSSFSTPSSQSVRQSVVESVTDSAPQPVSEPDNQSISLSTHHSLTTASVTNQPGSSVSHLITDCLIRMSLDHAMNLNYEVVIAAPLSRTHRRILRKFKFRAQTPRIDYNSYLDDCGGRRVKNVRNSSEMDCATIMVRQLAASVTFQEESHGKMN